MAVQIANPVVVAKVDRLAKMTGMTKTAIVERAVDRLADEMAGGAAAAADLARRMAAIMAQLDRIPDRKVAFDPLAWDQHGLPV